MTPDTVVRWQRRRFREPWTAYVARRGKTPLRALYRTPDIDGVGQSPKNRPVLARVFSAALTGVEAVLVRVEVDVASGLPLFTTVGLQDLAVRESRERVRTAIRNAGFGVLSDRITVNLAPADIRKEGAAFDLPIALGILAATGVLNGCRPEPCAVVGELALDVDETVEIHLVEE